MSAHKKSRAIKIVGTIIIFLVLTTIAAQLIFTSKVKTVLEEEIPPSINVSYEALSTNVLFGEISLNKVNAKHLVHNLDFEAESITISGLRYLPLLLNGDITIVDLTVRSPKMIYYHPSEKNSTSKPAKKAPVKTYVIKKFNIENGSFVVRNTSLDSTDTVEGIDFSISDILYGPESAKEDIPFSYGDFKLNTKKGYSRINKLEYATFEQMYLSPGEGGFKNFVWRTQYSPTRLSQKISTEHDHYHLKIEDISLRKWSFDIKNQQPYLYLSELQLQSPIFQVYRDKLLPNDTTHKKLYNKTLRDMQMDLQVDTIQISDGLITYKERVEVDVEPENISFSDIEAIIDNLHSRGQGETTVAINAKLMDNGPFSLDWSFDPLNKANTFLAKGSLSNFQTESINPFLKSNLQAEVKGTVQQMYFTISGNELESQGDIKMKYDNFEFTVLKKNRLGVNKLLTTAVNLFTKKGHKTDEDGFRHGSFTVKRQQDKSFFNYLWISLKAGLLDTVTGNGKKKS